MNKIGVVLESFHTDVDTAIRSASQIGADGVQFYGVNGDLDCDKLTVVQQLQIGKKISSYGLEISAICGDLGGYGFEVEDDNSYKIIKTAHVMEWANSIGCHIVTTHIGVIPAEQTETRRIMLDACKRLNEFSQKYKVYLAIETGPEPISVLNGFLKELDCPYICVNYDPANLVMITGDDPIKGVNTLKNYIVHTHAKDGIMKKKTSPERIYGIFAEGGIGDSRLRDYFEETPLTKGNVNIGAWINALQEINYKGFITIERETSYGCFEELNNCVKIIKDQLALNG